MAGNLGAVLAHGSAVSSGTFPLVDDSYHSTYCYDSRRTKLGFMPCGLTANAVGPYIPGDLF